jgi:AmiR/NasT family two-component response regulator
VRDFKTGECRATGTPHFAGRATGGLGAVCYNLMRACSSLAVASAESVYAVVASEFEHLRVLIADDQRERRELLARVVVGLGHEVIAGEIDHRAVAAVTAREEPDVALVQLGLCLQRALALIEQIVRLSSCPVIALLATENSAHVREAAKRGVFAHLVNASPEQLQSVIDVTLLRFADFHNLQGAFARRVVIEQAKGILMGRNEIDAKAAFSMLRDHSRHKGQNLLDVAAAVVDSHLLLPQPHSD